MATLVAPTENEARTLIDALLAEQRDLSAVERFSSWQESQCRTPTSSYRHLVPLTAPVPGEQYAFEVNLDKCSGCKACVSACHSLNGLDEHETWRSVGLLIGGTRARPHLQTVTTACHHCADPACANGCPVLAYDKDPLTGIVRHLDDQCIGCQYCILMCPYEVPRYSEARGIVRKCDMCHQRLSHGEAPACVQACPDEAIRITVVQTEKIRDDCRPAVTQNNATQTANGKNGHSQLALNRFLPGSPDPAITLPTTRYVSSRQSPQNLIGADAYEPRIQPIHAPLVWMLVFTQLGAGGFALLSLTSARAQAALALISFIGLLAGLAGSVLHLGQPLKAWRVFLGLRHSWLSREIVIFGLFALLATATTASCFFGEATWRASNIRGSAKRNAAFTLQHGAILAPQQPEGRVPVEVSSAPTWKPTLLGPTALFGILSVFCSGMVYHATQRECWRGQLSIGRFFGTTALLGFAAAWCAAQTAGINSTRFAVGLALVTSIKLSRELAVQDEFKNRRKSRSRRGNEAEMFLAPKSASLRRRLPFLNSRWLAVLRRCPVHAEMNEETPLSPLARSAFLMRFRLGLLVRSRIACGALGGIILPLSSLLPTEAGTRIAAMGLCLCLAGELAERALFFLSVATVKMPGGVAA